MTTIDGTPYGERVRILADDRESQDAVHFVDPDGTTDTLSWRDLETGAIQWGRTLAAAGAEPGRRVALAVPNSRAMVLGALGCWKIGAVPIPMRWDLPDWERDRLLAVIDPAVVIDEAHVDELSASAAAQSTEPLPVTTSPQVSGICSSGSTGTPKVILNKQPSIWSQPLATPFIANWDPTEREERTLVMGPMYHTNGFINTNYLLGGYTLVILTKFDAARAVDCIEKYRITNFTATPTMLARISRVPDIGKRDLSSIVFILQGAAVMPPNLLRTWFDLLGPEKIVMSYGMTENLGLAALRGDEWLEHEGSVGRGFRDTEIRILDDDGKDLPHGEIGNIYLRAPMTDAFAYLGGSAPAEPTEDGFRTAGDLGYLDDKGFLFLVDRRADMIITGGANVYPAEVETALSDHQEILDVVVLGIKDEAWGRRVHAVIQAAPGSELTEADVIAFSKSRLSPYKVPKTVEFVDELPRTAATKINRSAMVAQRGG